MTGDPPREPDLFDRIEMPMLLAFLYVIIPALLFAAWWTNR